MKRLTITTATDVRRWDTYTLTVPFNFDPHADHNEPVISDLLSRGKGRRESTTYEYEYQDVPDNFEVTEIISADED